MERVWVPGMWNANAKCTWNYSGTHDKVPRYDLVIVEHFNVKLACDDENSNQIVQGLECSN